MIQFAGQAQRHRMISQREGKSFIFCFALWGTAKVVCGYLLLLTVSDFWGHTYPFDITLLEIATSLSFITSGKCTIAFAYFRGEASRLVLTTSIMSVIFAICLFLILVTSAENHDHCEGTIECVTFFSIVLNGIFLFFLIKLDRSRAEFEVQEEFTDVPPPPYEVAIRDSYNQEGFGATRSPPIYTVSDNSHYETNITNYGYI